MTDEQIEAAVMDANENYTKVADHVRALAKALEEARDHIETNFSDELAENMALRADVAVMRGERDAEVSLRQATEKALAKIAEQRDAAKAEVEALKRKIDDMSAWRTLKGLP